MDLVCQNCLVPSPLSEVGTGLFDVYSMTCSLCIKEQAPKCFGKPKQRVENKADGICAVCLYSNACYERIRMKRVEDQAMTNEQVHAVRKVLRETVLRDMKVIQRHRPFPRAGYAQVVFDLCRRVHGSSKEERFNACGMNVNALKRIDRDIKLQIRDGWEWDVVEDEQYLGQLRVYNVRKCK